MSVATESLDYLVLDAGAIIRGHGLNLFKNTKTIVTVPEVIAEIRDSKSRDLLNSLPFEIEERVPSTDSFKAVIEFAKKTGDFAALSKTDLKVIALSYMLEVEIHGSIAEKTSKIGNAATDIRMIHAAKQNSNTTAKSTHVLGDNDTDISMEQASVTTAVTDLESAVCDMSLDDKFGVQLAVEQTEQPAGEAHHDEDAQAVDSAALTTAKPAFSWANMVKSGNTKPVAYVAPVVQPKTIPRNVVVGDVETVEALIPALHEETRASQQQSQSNIISRQSDLGSTKAESQRLAIEDDGVGWINASNLTSHLSISGGQLGVRSTDNAPTKSKKKKTAKRAVRVACVTTDFSMQNVLMQIGLNIMSVDGLLIRSVKQWVLRCMGCYQVHYDMDRLFCVKCGTNHLSRVSASIDSETGVLKLHLKKNYQNDTRGTKYSLPAPGKQDRYSGELLLREDQLLSGIWRQKCVKIRKDIKSVFGEDVTSDVGLHINKSQSIKVGLGQRNPNATKGRERRGKAKK